MDMIKRGQRTVFITTDIIFLHLAYYVEIPLSFYFLHFLYKNTSKKGIAKCKSCIDFIYIKKSKLLEKFRLNRIPCKFPAQYVFL